MRCILVGLLLSILTVVFYATLESQVKAEDFNGYARCVVARFHPLPKKTRLHVWDPKSGWYVEVDKGGHK